MISRVVVVPHPPLLVPELAAGDVGECVELREACLSAVARLAEVSGHWLAVGAATGAPVIPLRARGSLRGFGANVGVSLAASPGAEADLPLPALVAAWLRERVGASEVDPHLIDPAATPGDCVRFAAGLGDTEALLVLGDGSRRRGPEDDGRAAAFDDRLATAFAEADVAVLAGLDPVLADELGVAGRAPWQVLAALAEGAAWHGELLYSAAPFGVGYHVAVWERG
ncbi:hypothetical protein [Amycolatopsis sp. H20-H5]|uniref:hypothetical protein n=1 Tax=Amycolatopsis sp. H20-H5 TaxID=3046309 RepID=UPI002DB846B5|nr:hypothetical protein [Amycolatopsis sp. H20-H5]MEC3973993.1 hypothetical protein [Amycolatopsis sp. H20-H5]